MNRLTRDEILHRALDMLDSPALDNKDRPAGQIELRAISLSWLQDGIDLFHREFPFQGSVKTTAVTLDSNGAFSLPSLFIVDVRDGLVVTINNSPVRLARRGLQQIIDAQVVNPNLGDPEIYCVVSNQILYHPAPKTSLSAKLWYYALPSLLNGTDVPAFPTDWLLVEYVRLRGLEWLRQAQPGTAREYAYNEVKRLKAAGLLGEPESDRIPLDRRSYRPRPEDPSWGWMGPTVPR